MLSCRELEQQLHSILQLYHKHLHSHFQPEKSIFFIVVTFHLVFFWESVKLWIVSQFFIWALVKVYPISYFMNCEEGFTVNINWIMLLQTVNTWQELLNIRIRRRSPPSHGIHHDIQNKSKKISCFDFVLFLWSWDYQVMDKDDWRGAYINFFLPFL